MGFRRASWRVWGPETAVFWFRRIAVSRHVITSEQKANFLREGPGNFMYWRFTCTSIISRAGIPGFAWLSWKNKPKKKFALTREKQKKKPPTSTKTHKKHRKTPKNTKKTPKFFFGAYARKKKPPKKSFRAYARKHNHLPGLVELSQKRRYSRPDYLL